jgi:hypothetical protein
MASCASVHIFTILAAILRSTYAHSHNDVPGAEAHGLAAMLRDFMGGGKARNFFHRYFQQDIPDVPIGSSGPVKIYPDGLKEQTFLSTSVALAQGEISNKWMPLAWPKGHIAVKSFAADLVRAGPHGEEPPISACCDGDYVAPREEVFMHHWTVNKWQLPKSLFESLVKSHGRNYDLESSWKDTIETWLADTGNNAGANGPCRNAALHLYFGIGNEVRGTPPNMNHSYEFPDPYGVEFNEPDMKKIGEFMMLNLHLIDTRNVTDTRRCVECDCDYIGVTPLRPSYIGGLACCHSTSDGGAKCPVVQNALPKRSETYYMRYTVQWRDFDPVSTLPLEVITFDATDNNTQWSDLSWLPSSYKEAHTSFHSDKVAEDTISGGKSGDFLGAASCHVEYFVPPCGNGDACVHKLPNSWVLPYSVDIVFVRSHFHTGGINMTLRSETQQICAGVGSYGNDTHMLSNINACKVGTSEFPVPVRIDRGSSLFTETFYKQDSKPHFGVMAMSFVFAHIPPSEGKPSILV